VTLDASTSTVQGTASYLWNTGATTSTIGVVEPGVYEVTVTDGENGCSATATVEVIENTSNVEAVITGNEVLTCDTTEVTLDASTSTVQGTVSYLWNTGATTSTIGVVEPGVYEVTVTDGENGCSATATVEVIENTSNVEAVITGNEVLTCDTTEVTLDASTSVTQGEVSYLWSNGATTATIAVTEPGSYSVTVSDTSSGCFGSTTIEITQDITPREITGDSIDLCIEDETYDLTNLLGDNFVSGGTWVDVNNSEGLTGDFFDPSIVNLESFEFTYTEPGDCGRIITVIVNVNDDCVVLACSTEELTISKVITPNNDGINDTFDLLGLEDCGFTFNVQVFNRWGKMVFQSNNYQNNWRGYPNVSGLTIGSSTILPTGTYYYVVNVLSSGFKPITGYIYLGTH
ncbi:gliding motility-associated C-terminal domain-containing protein, partial [Lutibacter sp.]|uniref:gliding motility-associated C-terminal domain-containing protein n=1 Tax=Lutibacter sp. TaxID=1925666 RepID=UPI0025BECA43